MTSSLKASFIPEPFVTLNYFKRLPSWLGNASTTAPNLGQVGRNPGTMSESEKAAHQQIADKAAFFSQIPSRKPSIPSRNINKTSINWFLK
jgi:hypothetical protein